MARMKAPAARGFTRAERRSLRFETVALVVMMLVAFIAAIISFFALSWVGRHIGMPVGLSWLVPVAIDGFAIACSVGIIRSQAEGESARARLSEWAGLAYALALSLAGNIIHSLNLTYSVPIPVWLVIAYASAPPVIVAYGLHVYGRAQSKGVSAHVMVDDPDRIHFDINHLGDQPNAPRAPRVTAAPAARAVDAAPARAPREEPARPARAEKNEAHEQVFEEYRARRASGDRMQGGEIADKLGINAGHARNLRKQWDVRIEDELAIAEPARDPILEQVPERTDSRPVRSA